MVHQFTNLICFLILGKMAAFVLGGEESRGWPAKVEFMNGSKVLSDTFDGEPNCE